MGERGRRQCRCLRTRHRRRPHRRRHHHTGTNMVYAVPLVQRDRQRAAWNGQSVACVDGLICGQCSIGQHVARSGSVTDGDPYDRPPRCRCRTPCDGRSVGGRIARNRPATSGIILDASVGSARRGDFGANRRFGGTGC